MRAADARRARGPAAAPRGPLRGGAGRDHRGRPPDLGVAGRRPPVPARRPLAAAPAGRRYLAGWAMASELHILNDEPLERRAAGEDSLRALLGTAERLYAQLVLAANNDRAAAAVGAATLRPLPALGVADRGRRPVLRRPDAAVPRRRSMRRMREGKPPAFPPSARDAIILGGTVFDLLDREGGRHACEVLVSRLRREGPQRGDRDRLRRAAARGRGASGATTCARRSPAPDRSPSWRLDDPFRVAGATGLGRPRRPRAAPDDHDQGHPGAGQQQADDQEAHSRPRSANRSRRRRRPRPRRRRRHRRSSPPPTRYRSRASHATICSPGPSLWATRTPPRPGRGGVRDRAARRSEARRRRRSVQLGMAHAVQVAVDVARSRPMPRKSGRPVSPSTRTRTVAKSSSGSPAGGVGAEVDLLRRDRVGVGPQGLFVSRVVAVVVAGEGMRRDQGEPAEQDREPGSGPRRWRRQSPPPAHRSTPMIDPRGCGSWLDSICRTLSHLARDLRECPDERRRDRELRSGSRSATAAAARRRRPGRARDRRWWRAARGRPRRPGGERGCRAARRRGSRGRRSRGCAAGRSGCPPRAACPGSAPPRRCCTAIAALTSSPPTYWGLTLRAFSWAAVIGSSLTAPDVDERHLAIQRRSAPRAGTCARRVGQASGSTLSLIRQHRSTSSTSGPSIRNARTTGASPASEQITHSAPGHQRARLTSVCEG